MVQVFIIASLVPILRGVPRRGSGIWQPNAELLIGRVAMLGCVQYYFFLQIV